VTQATNRVSTTGRRARVGARQLRPALELLESKIAPPFARPGIVDRTSLVARLCASRAPVVCVTAPPGYGKTTLLAQWAERDLRPFAWISLDDHDNDPAVLLRYVAVALDRLQPADSPPLPTSIFANRFSIGNAIPRLASAMASMPPFILALDDVHRLDDRECLDAITRLTRHVPGGSTFAFAGWRDPPVPMARLRGTGEMVEVDAGDLALDDDQSHHLLRGEGLDLTDAMVVALRKRTEGWPVALRLAAQWVREGDPDQASAFKGDDRLMADYLRLEVLSKLPQRDVAFMTRTSVLDELSGPLCDAILKTKGAGRVLEALERSNCLLVPLDRNRESYRYHHLFRELLRAELERREAHRVPELLRLAADWCEANGRPEAAIRYAQANDDVDRVARLVTINAQSVFQRGHAATVERWLEWLEANGAIERHAAAAVLGVWLHAVRGRPAEAERWADKLTGESLQSSPPDGSPSLEPWLAMVHGMLCRDGVERMRADAQLALRTIAPGSSIRPQAMLLLGLALLLSGELAEADDVMADAAEEAEWLGATNAAVLALSERAVLAIERDDWERAEAFLERASEIRDGSGLDGYVTSALGYAASSRLAAHRGDRERARAELARAQRLRPMLTYAIPHLAVQTLLAMTRVHMALADAAGARTLVREVDQVLRRRPELGTLRAQTEDVREQLEAFRAGTPGVSTLTTAELRLLPYLRTHHSFREIGERLHVSPHTVKTQAISIYRKLGVTSRSGAIEHALDLGLLDP